MDLKEITDARNPVPVPGVPRLPNINALTSIRFFAALHVALYHMVRPFSQWGPLENPMSVGYIGVSFFFVLSGFILTYSHAAEYEAGRGDAVRFWVARLARVYPVYLLSMLLSAYVGRAQFHPFLHVVIFGADLLMVQSWSVHMVGFFNVPAWSLSCEAFFYLVFPFVFLKMRPSSAGKAITWIAGMWALAMAVPLYCVIRYPLAGMHDHGAGVAGGLFVRGVERVPLAALPEFLAGISMAWLYLRFRPKARTLTMLTTAGVLAYLAVLAFADRLPFVMLHNGLLIPIYATLMLGLCGRSWLSKLLENKVMILLGEASFALYLVHFLFNEWVTKELGAGWTIQAAVWKLAVVIPISVLLHVYVERPGRKRILQYWKQRQASA